jgi:chromosome segregation ATPase
MSESLWNSEVAVQDQPQQEQPQQQAEEKPAEEPVAESEALALSVDEFSALEDRVLRAVNLVKRERQDRAAAEERASAAEAKLSEQSPQVENLQKEVSALHAERDDVRKRVERLLAQLDALEL